jgi:predicted hydrolase (HD superfamily)
MNEINKNVKDILIKHSQKDTPEESLKEILKNEIQRSLKKHMLMIKHFERKYNMDFETFEQNRVTKDSPYELERDYFEWDMAITLIEDLKEELTQLGY